MASLPEHLMPMPAGRHPLPREVMEAHQRDRVLDAATEVFAKRGYQATTIDHIVAAAKIGVGSFYSLFDGKQDCFLQAYDRIVAAAWDRIEAALPAARPWSEQAAAALRGLLESIAADPHGARVAIVEVQTAGSAALTRYQETLARIARLLRKGRAVSPVAGELPATLENATVAGVTWLLHQRIVVGEVEGIESLLPELLEIVVEPYLGDDLSRSPAAGRTASPSIG